MQRRRPRGQLTPRVSIEDRGVKIAVPERSRYKGHAPFPVLEPVASVRAARYQHKR
jgi:hypothetical protein